MSRLLFWEFESEKIEVTDFTLPDRYSQVMYEDRVSEVPYEDRVSEVPYEDRVSEVPRE